MENASRGGDGNLAELVHGQPPEMSELDAAIQRATQARLFFQLALEVDPNEDSD